MLVAFSEGNKRIIQLALSSLTSKQKNILAAIGKSSGTTISSLAKKTAGELGCSESSVWVSIKGLREAGIVAKRAKGKPVKLTVAGKILLRMMEND